MGRVRGGVSDAKERGESSASGVSRDGASRVVCVCVCVSMMMMMCVLIGDTW